MLYMITYAITLMLTIIFAIKGSVKEVLAKLRKDVKVIIDKGSTSEVTYAKITQDNLLEERGKKNHRTWIITDPEDIKYSITEKQQIAYVTNKAFTLNKDVVLAAKFAWQNSRKVSELIDSDTKKFNFQIKDGEELYEYMNDELDVEGTTINSKYVDKAITAKSASAMHEQINTRANEIANRQLQKKPMSSFMYGLIGAAIGIGITYLIIQQNTLDPSMITDMVSNQATETVAQNVTNM